MFTAGGCVTEEYAPPVHEEAQSGDSQPPDAPVSASGESAGEDTPPPVLPAGSGEAVRAQDVDPAAASPAEVPASALGAYDFAGDAAQVRLPSELREVSGLAMDGEGRLFAHQDERAIIFQIEPATGEIVPSFKLGRNGIRGDFEGVAVAGERMFLVSSDGVLYAFTPPGADGESRYERMRLDTGSRCSEVEGLDYDARFDELLLACKVTRGRALRDRLLVFAFSLRSNSLLDPPRLNVALDVLARDELKAELSASGIAVHPVTGTLFVIAARENLVVELTRSGELLGTAKLRSGTHRQPEGIAFAADGTLYIADEAPSGRATLTVYRPDVARFRPATE